MQRCISRVFRDVYERCGGKENAVLVVQKASPPAPSAGGRRRHFQFALAMAAVGERQRGAHIVDIDARLTDRVCHRCCKQYRHARAAEASQRPKSCPACDPEHPDHPRDAADLNAALNVLAISAYRGVFRTSVVPEPFRVP